MVSGHKKKTYFVVIRKRKGEYVRLTGLENMTSDLEWGQPNVCLVQSGLYFVTDWYYDSGNQEDRLMM